MLLTGVADPPIGVRAGTAGNRDWEVRGLLARLPASISEAIARTAATGAVGALLSDRAAAVRETTLDELIATAAARTERQDPLTTSRVPDGSSTHASTEPQDLAAVGSLDEATLLHVAQRGQARLCAAILALAAGTPASAVDRAVMLRSAKGVVSLVWKAGFSMRAAEPLQELLGRIPPWLVLHATADGGFPLTTNEMRWQIEFLTRQSG